MMLSLADALTTSQFGLSVSGINSECQYYLDKTMNQFWLFLNFFSRVLDWILALGGVLGMANNQATKR